MAGNPDDWPQVIAQDAFDAVLPADVPLTDKPGGTRIGTARISKTEFNNRFTVKPDTGITVLHCYTCDQEWEIGWHPSLDVVNEQARLHNRDFHA